ncbi:MAG: DEAD/DEAH box helicase [Chryseobacterium sp.]|nr:MAG: DEAD/DEAH box helicase [Chryseobacterium sp.]
MKLTFEGGKVIIQVSGMHFLRLKAEIAKRLGRLCQSGKDIIEFPTSCLILLEDLLDDDSKNDESVRQYLGRFESHAHAREIALQRIETSSVEGIPDNWLDLLDPAQATAVSAMVLPNILGLCLFDEQGSGKTVMTIAAFDILKDSGTVDAMIVVCPKSMVSEWPNDIEKFTHNKYAIIQAEGDRNQKYASAFKPFDVLITNYEGIEVMLTSLIASTSTRKYLLTVDESYYLKNGESVRSEKVSKLRSYCERCFVLCGTPAPNSAHDLINQFDLADSNYTFAGFSRSNLPDLDFDRISALVESRGLFIRRLKPEILAHVPDKHFHIVKVDLQGRQAAMYEAARQDLELELRTLNNETFRKRLATYFQRRAALLQICACPEAIDPTFSETPAKYTVLDELIERLFYEKRKLIVWSFFRKSLDQLEDRYRKFNPVRVDGSIPSAERKAAVKSFQENPDTMLFLGNPAAAGAGITLHASYDAAYISYSNQAAHYLQSLDRIHRRGQVSDDVNYYLIICTNTIEETEVIRLREKEVRQHGLLGDHIPWPTSLDDALNELSQGA